MTQEEILRMARMTELVSWLSYDECWWIDAHEPGEELRRFAELVAAKEREACAKAFEAEADTWIAWLQRGSAKRKGAEAIRARGQEC